jgi:hypothetical protein
MPLSNIQWIKNQNQISNNRFFHIKTQSKLNENEECQITILTIHVNLFRKIIQKKILFV